MPSDNTFISFTKLFEDVASQYPQRIAFDSTGHANESGTRYDYARLNETVNKWVKYLADLGVKQDSIVSTCTESAESNLILLLAILKASATYAPLPIFKGNLTSDEVYSYQRKLNNYFLNIKPDFVLASTKQAIFFRDEKRISRLIDASDTEIAIQSIDFIKNPILREAKWAYILGTSGSTGKPKFVRNSGRALITRVEAHRQRMDLKPEDRVAQIFPFTYDASLMEITMALGSGAALIPVPNSDDLGEAIEFCKQQQITAGIFFPNYINLLHETKITKMVCMGDKGNKNDFVTFLTRNKAANIYVGYGVTEATIAATLGKFDLKSNTVVLGKPIPGVILRVYARAESDKAADEKNLLCQLDAQHDIPGSHANGTGELYIADDNGGVGEYLESGLNNTKFVSIDDKIFYKSGDSVTIVPEGLVFNNRFERSYKSAVAGWVHPLFLEEEIKKILQENFQIPAEYFTVILEMNPKAKYLIAAILLKPGTIFGEDSIQEVHRHLRQNIDSDLYATIPGHWAIVFGDPHAQDKIAAITQDIRASRLKTILVRPRLEALPVEYRTYEEKRLIDIWREVLGIPEEISTQHRFFDHLGASSISYFHMQEKVRQFFKVAIDKNEFFRHQTIAYLGRLIRQSRNENIDKLTMQPITESAKNPELAAADQLPLFLIHGGDGGINSFYHYNNDKKLKSRAIYAIRSPGLQHMENLGDTVAETADYYARLIDRKLATFPNHNECIIAGWSAGGVIGLEVRHQLKRKYHIDAYLFLIDSKAPAYYHNITYKTFHFQIKGFISHIINLEKSTELIKTFNRDFQTYIDTLNVVKPEVQIQNMLAFIFAYKNLPDEFIWRIVTAIKTAQSIGVNYEVFTQKALLDTETTTLFVVPQTELEFQDTYLRQQDNTVLGWNLPNLPSAIASVRGSIAEKSGNANSATHINVTTDPVFILRLLEKLKDKDSRNITSQCNEALFIPVMEAPSLYFLNYDVFANDPGSETALVAEYQKRIQVLTSKKSQVISLSHMIVISSVIKVSKAIEDYRSNNYKSQISALKLVTEALSQLQVNVTDRTTSIYPVMAMLSLYNLRALLYRVLRKHEEAFFDFTQCHHILMTRLTEPTEELTEAKVNLGKIRGTIYSNIGHTVDEISTAARIYSPPRIQILRFVDNYLNHCKLMAIEPLIKDDPIYKYTFFNDAGMQFHRLARMNRGSDLLTEHGHAYALSSITFYWRRKMVVTQHHLRNQKTLQAVYKSMDVGEIQDDLDFYTKQMQTAYSKALQNTELLKQFFERRGLSDTHSLPLRFMLHLARLHKHGGNYEKSLEIYDSMLSGKRCSDNILLELKRERADVIYLKAIEDTDPERTKSSLQEALRDLDVYIRHQNDYSKMMFNELVSSEGRNVLTEIENNLRDAQAKREQINQQITKLLEPVIVVPVNTKPEQTRRRITAKL